MRTSGRSSPPALRSSVSSLFTTGGAAATDYAFIVPTGAGTIDLNGATNDWGAQTPGYTGYQVTAAQLSLLTYVAPATGGAQMLEGQATSPANGPSTARPAGRLTLCRRLGRALE